MQNVRATKKFDALFWFLFVVVLERETAVANVKSKKRRFLLWAAVLSAALFVLLVFGNRYILPTRYQLKTSAELPGGSLRIASISDLHGDFFESRRMLDLLTAHQPDLIALTGDVFSRGEYDEARLLELGKRLCAIAPTFYVSGNHEAAGGYLTEIERTLRESGVTVLSNQQIEFDGIRIVGMEDYAYFTASHSLTEASRLFAKTLSALTADPAKDQFTLLLSHRPDAELVGMYADCGADLVLCGHTHGGIIRVPFVGGLISKNGLFPKYDGGAFTLESGGCMIINRGLGNGLAPVRVFNHPEVCLITVTQEPAP